MGFLMQSLLRVRRQVFMLISVKTVNAYRKFQMVGEFLIFAATVVVLL